MRAGNQDFQGRAAVEIGREAVDGREAVGNAADEVDLGGVITALARRKGLILGATLGCAAAALAFCLVVKPRYIAETSVIVEDQESFFNRADPSLREMPQVIDAEAINSQIQLVKSRDLARAVIAKLHLQSLPEFDPSASGLLGALSAFGIGDTSAAATEDKLLTNFSEHLEVMSPTKSRILQIQFQSRNPDLAAQTANTIADAFIDLKQKAKRDDAAAAAQSLKAQIAVLQKRVTEAEDKVAQFRVANGLYESSANITLPTQQLGEIATKLGDARAAQSEAVAKAKALRDLLARGRLADAAEIGSNDLVRTVSARRSAIEAQLAADSRTLLPGHPKIKEMQAQLSDIETQLRAAVEKAARGLDNDARVAAARVANLTSLLDEQKKAVGASNGVETELRDLQRQAKTLKDQLETESTKYQAALARKDSESAPADARVVSRASSPSLPAFPKKIPITIFGAVAGLFFSCFFVIASSLGGGSGVPSPTSSPLAGAGGGARSRTPARGGFAPAGAAAAAPRAQGETGMIGRFKSALSDFGSPAVRLEEDEAAGTGQENAAQCPEGDVWVRDPFAASASRPARAAPDDPAFAPERRSPHDNRAAEISGERVSSDLLARIAEAGDGQGVIALLADSGAGSAPPHALATARALARKGRAILVQAGADRRLDAALGNGPDADQPGLADLLAGEVSFAEAIFRDGASRLHVLARGDGHAHDGALEAEAEDVREIIDVLRATYDFVLVAVSADALGLDLAASADVVVILGKPSARRDYLHDDFAAAGARELVLAAPDFGGTLSEGAA